MFALVTNTPVDKSLRVCVAVGQTSSPWGGGGVFVDHRKQNQADCVHQKISRLLSVKGLVSCIGTGNDGGL